MTATTPLWVPLVVAIVGLVATIVGTIAGALITQRRSDRREQVAWERERERQHAAWTREDAARTYDLRRVAYVSFHEAADRAMQAVIQRYEELAATGKASPPPDAILLEVFRSMESVSVYGADRVVTVARDVFNTLSIFSRILAEGKATVPANLKEFEAGCEKRISSLLEAIRLDLGIPMGSTIGSTSPVDQGGGR